MNYGITNELFIGYCFSKHLLIMFYSIHVSRLLNGTRFRRQPSKQRMKRVGSKQRAYLGMERSLKRSFNTPIKDYLCKGRPPRASSATAKRTPVLWRCQGHPRFFWREKIASKKGGLYVTTTGCPNKS